MAMTTEQYLLREEVREDLLAVLRVAIATRVQHEAPADGAIERRRMRESVNRWRIRLAMPRVSAEEIERIEATAVGHIDYAEKFALRCADLAVGAC